MSCRDGATLLRWPGGRAPALGLPRRQMTPISRMARMAASVTAETLAEKRTPRAQTSASRRRMPDESDVSTHVPGAFHAKTCACTCAGSKLPSPRAAHTVSEKPVM